MNRIKTFFFFLMLAFGGCDVLETPVFQNPNDPESEYFVGRAPSDLIINTIADSIIELKWKNNSNAIKDYIIERRSGDAPYVEIGIVGGSDSTFTDTLTLEEELFSYRIKAVSPTNLSSISDPVNVRLEYYLDTLKIFDSNPAFTFSPDHKLMAVMKYGYENRIYDVTNDYKLISEFNGSPGVFAFTSDNRDLVCDNVVNKVIEVRDVLSGLVIRKIDRKYDVNALAISPDDSHLVTSDGIFTYIWDLKNGSLIKQFGNPSVFMYPVKFVFSHDGKYLACVNSGYNITIRETTTWTAIQNLSSGFQTDVFFTLDNRFLLYSIDSDLAAWDLSRSELKRKNISNFTFSISPDQQTALIYGGYINYYFELWKMNGIFPSVLLNKVTMNKEIRKAAINKFGYIHILDKDNELIIWSAKKRWIIFE